MEEQQGVFSWKYWLSIWFLGLGQRGMVAEYQPSAFISKQGISKSLSFLTTISPQGLNNQKIFLLVLHQQS